MNAKIYIRSIFLIGMCTNLIGCKSAERLAYEECSELLVEGLKSPSSYDLQGYFLSVAELITPQELEELGEYKYRMAKKHEIDSGTMPEDDLLFEYHVSSANQAELWHAEAKNNNLWSANLWITYDASNSFGAIVRGRASCNLIWIGPSLQDALVNSSFRDPRNAHVQLQ